MSKAQKNLWDICSEKGIKTTFELASFLSNRKLTTVIAPSGRAISSHNYQKKILCNKSIVFSSNQVLSVNHILGAGNGLPLCDSKYGSTTIYIYELALGEETLKDVKLELDRVNKQFELDKESLYSKIKIMEESGLDIYDERLINMIKVMGELEFKKGSSVNKVSLAKMILDVV